MILKKILNCNYFILMKIIQNYLTKNNCYIKGQTIKVKGKTFASNHADIYHWWKNYFNYTMDDFRNEVKKDLESKGKKMKFNTGIEALNYLTEKGRITNKVYWEKVLDTTRNTEYLFVKWTEDVYLLEE